MVDTYQTEFQGGKKMNYPENTDENNTAPRKDKIPHVGENTEPWRKEEESTSK